MLAPASRHPLLEAAIGVADAVLAPMAEQVDRSDTVPASHLAALADAGLFGLAGPSSGDAPDLDAATFRRIVAAIAGGCGATFFVWVQHHGVVRLVAEAVEREPHRGEILADLCAGSVVAGTAFAHVRRRGAPAISATPTDGGWRLDGVAPWATSWGIAERFSVAAETADGDIVWSLLRAGPETPVAGLTATPLELPVLGATRTVSFRFDSVHVDASDVVHVETASAWRASDRVRAAAGQPAPLGVAHRAVRRLRGFEEVWADDVADALGRQLESTWVVDDALGARARSLAPDDVEEFVRDGARHRAEMLALARSATTALLAATGGGGMDLGHPAQRLAREADFYVVQAQTHDGRRALLDEVVRRLDR